MEAEVQKVLDYTIFRVEKQSNREMCVEPQEAALGFPRSWSCVMGCKHGACARAAFRRQCVPSSSAWNSERGAHEVAIRQLSNSVGKKLKRWVRCKLNATVVKFYRFTLVYS